MVAYLCLLAQIYIPTGRKTNLLHAMNKCVIDMDAFPSCCQDSFVCGVTPVFTLIVKFYFYCLLLFGDSDFEKCCYSS